SCTLETSRPADPGRHRAGPRRTNNTSRRHHPGNRNSPSGSEPPEGSLRRRRVQPHFRPYAPSFASSAASFGLPPAGGTQSTWITVVPLALSSSAKLSRPTLTTLTSPVSRLFTAALSAFMPPPLLRSS